MSSEFKWDEADPHILIITVAPPITWNDIMDALNKGGDMVRGVDRNVVVIWDATEMKMMPPASNPLTQLREFAANRPQNLIAYIFVGGSSLGRQVISILEKALFLRWVLTARTMEEGYRLAHEKLGL